MKIYARHRLNKLTAILILFAAVAITQACDPGRDFAKNTARAAGAISSGIALVDQQTTSGQMTKETGLRILAALEASNKINGALTDEAKKYVSADGKRFEITGEGKLKILQIGASGQGVITALLNDPAFTSLPSERRAAYVAFAQTINNSFSAIVQLVAAIKPQGGGEMKKTITAAGAASPTIGGATAWINFITWSALEILKQIIAESARSGKSVAELIEEAQAQTKLNAAQIDELKARLTNPQA